ncbi:MAG: methylmalonyl-CoA mutase, partial [Flavobacteriales bacterium]
MEKLFKEFSPKTLREWNEKIITDLKGKDYNNLIWDSPENIKIAPVYNSESVSDYKGETTHHHTDWEIEQTLNKPSNKQVLASLNGGASALLISNVDSKDLEAVLENVLIQYIQISIQSDEIENSIEALLKLIEKRKLDKTTIKGSLQYDPLMAALKKGEFDSNIWNKFKAVQEKTSSLSAYK